VATPNLSEARELTGLGPEADAEELARAVRGLGPKAVVVTGGHTESGEDVYFDGETIDRIDGPRHPDGASHGSGCTHSSALAAFLARGMTPLGAARSARLIAAEAVGAGLRDVGEGAGPVDALGIADRRA
jgi:hydroxymethylpyrimidine/phosphomethylpyrimidine kinase